MKVGDADFDEAVEAVLGILREVAAHGENDRDGRITYMQLSERLQAERGISVPYYQGPLPHILGEASKREHESGRGMIFCPGRRARYPDALLRFLSHRTCRAIQSAGNRRTDLAQRVATRPHRASAIADATEVGLRVPEAARPQDLESSA